MKHIFTTFLTILTAAQLTHAAALTCKMQVLDLSSGDTISAEKSTPTNTTRTNGGNTRLVVEITNYSCSALAAATPLAGEYLVSAQAANKPAALMARTGDGFLPNVAEVTLIDKESMVDCQCEVK